jgi:hypothetical protein
VRRQCSRPSGTASQRAQVIRHVAELVDDGGVPEVARRGIPAAPEGDGAGYRESRLGLSEKRDGSVSLEGAGGMRACRGRSHGGDEVSFVNAFVGVVPIQTRLRPQARHCPGPGWTSNGWLLLLWRTISASERAASTWAASRCGSSIPSSSSTNSSPSRMSKKYRVITLEIRDGRRLFRRGFGKDQASVDLTGPAIKR